MTQLLNIMSQGHSGSTTLNMLLGRIPGFFSAGELMRLTWQLGRDPEEEHARCTCGAAFRQCPVWSQVVPPKAFDDPYGTFLLAFLQPQEWLATAPAMSRRLPELIYRRLAQHGLPTGFIRPFHAREIARRNFDLVDRIGEVTGASVVVDSTKGLVRYHLLNRFRPYRTILLMRDPRGLAASAIKYGRDPKSAIGNWLHLHERIYSFMKSNGVRPIVVSYEDMCNSPEAVQRRIAALFPAGGPVNDFHLAAGNPSRFRPFEIREDRSWETVLPADVASIIAAHQSQVADLRSRLLELQ